MIGAVEKRIIKMYIDQLKIAKKEERRKIKLESPSLASPDRMPYLSKLKAGNERRKTENNLMIEG